MPSFPTILKATSIESCLKPLLSKRNVITNEELSMNKIFASSKKGSTTFYKILEEKGVFMPTSCDPSTFASAPNVSCDKKPTHSFTHLPSEDRYPSAVPCVSSYEFEDNSHVSVTSTLSSHSSSTSCLHSIVESKFRHLKDSRFH